MVARCHSLRSASGAAQRSSAPGLHFAPQRKLWYMEELQQSIFEGNYQSAKNNLSQEEEMGSLHAEVEVLKSQLIEKINKFHEIRDSQASLLSGMSPTELYETLKSGADESLAKSDAISDDFLSGKIGIDKFVEDYSKVRQEYHGRMAKLEKIDRQKRMY